MSTLDASASFNRTSDGAHAFKTLTNEAVALLQALLQPGKIIGEVQQMHALQVQARRIEATNPAQAAELRRRAARIGLR
jgi:hypothetical protein